MKEPCHGELAQYRGYLQLTNSCRSASCGPGTWDLGRESSLCTEYRASDDRANHGGRHALGPQEHAANPPKRLLDTPGFTVYPSIAMYIEWIGEGVVGKLDRGEESPTAGLQGQYRPGRVKPGCCCRPDGCCWSIASIEQTAMATHTDDGRRMQPQYAGQLLYHRVQGLGYTRGFTMQLEAARDWPDWQHCCAVVLRALQRGTRGILHPSSCIFSLCACLAVVVREDNATTALRGIFIVNARLQLRLFAPWGPPVDPRIGGSECHSGEIQGRTWGSCWLALSLSAVASCPPAVGLDAGAVGKNITQPLLWALTSDTMG
jgi:hypothetical protein